MSARKSTLAGSWYPGTAAGCEKEINQYLKDESLHDKSGGSPIGGIVPHAGWYFSGKLACHVIHRLVEEEPPDVVVVFGMHLHPGSPFHIMAEGEWETPLGNLRIEEDLAGELVRRFDFQIETASTCAQDNTIELQLPFIKYFFQEAKIVPIGVPPVEKSLEIGKAVAKAAGQLGLKTAVLGSTDLTHYGVNYGYQPKGSGAAAIDWARNENDRRVIDAMTAMNPVMVLDEALANRNACCAGAAATAIAAAKKLGAENAQTLAYANSYDKSPGDSFVGYVGMVFER